MNSSLLLHTNHPSTPLFNPTPLRFTLKFSQKQRRSFRYNSIVRSCSAVAVPDKPSSSNSNSVKPDVFGGKKELSPLQSLVDSMSPPIRIATSALVFAVAVAAGYTLGVRFGGSRNAGIGAAIALGAAGAGAAYALNSCAPDVAAINLHNYVSDIEDPATLNKEDIEAIANKYGVSKQNEAFNAEIRDIYCRYVSAVLPTGTDELRGDEADTITKFKNALGIDDPDAADVHMEIGRRIFRQRLETGDRDADSEQRRAFQKLIYVSTIVFGEASVFLLPWKRVFKVTDSQVEVAIRDNAQRLYASKLKSVGREIDANQLVCLREAQLTCRLSDERAEEMFKDHVRKLVEENISTAVGILKSRTRAKESTRVIEELETILSFNNLLISLKSHPDASRFTPGVGPLSFVGGDGDRKMDDLKLLFKAYVSDSLAGGRMEENKHAALNQLRNIFGLGRREADAITLDVTSKVYRKRLAQAFTSGDLEAAESKAAYLQNLCEELNFDPQKALEMHQEIYRQKLQQLVTDGKLSDDDMKALERLQVMLCIPKQTVEAAYADICGSSFEKVVEEALSVKTACYDTDLSKFVRKAAHGLQLTREIAMSIASKAVRKVFISYIRRARAAESPTKQAEELKKMILFNRYNVSRLVRDIKGERAYDIPPEEDRLEFVEDVRRQSLYTTPPEEPQKEEQVQQTDEEDEVWETLRSLRKVKPFMDKLREEIQTEITLKDDLPERDRTELYKTYLVFCQTGKVHTMSFGMQMTTATDDSEYELLSELGSILGLTDKKIVELHRGLAEQKFRREAEAILADGQFTKGRQEQLSDLQRKIGLPPQYAQKIIKGITNTKLAAALETAVRQGRLSIKDIRELIKSSVDINTMISESLRESLFKRTAEGIFSSGTGEFDEVEVYENIPKDLNINADKAKEVVHQLARSRLSNSLLQAVSLLRQRNHKALVLSLNDLLACDKAVPSKPLSWEVPEELADLFIIYVKSDPPAEKLSRLQYLLGISDSKAETLKAMKDRALQNATAEDEEFVF